MCSSIKEGKQNTALAYKSVSAINWPISLFTVPVRFVRYKYLQDNYKTKHNRTIAYKYVTFPAELHVKLSAAVAQLYDESRYLNLHKELVADGTQPIDENNYPQPIAEQHTFYRDHPTQIEVLSIVPLLSAPHEPNQRKTPTKRQQSTSS